MAEQFLKAQAEESQSKINFPLYAGNPATSNTVLMIAPLDFSQNMTTLEDNTYMKVNPTYTKEFIRTKAAEEFRGLYEAVTKAGINVRLYLQETQHNTPDACFPNNWFSTHTAAESPAGVPTLVLYPMKAPNRRLERRAEIIASLKSSYPVVIDLTHYEEQNKYLEGTGSMVLDRVHRVCYVSLSERAHLEVAQDWATQLGYSLVAFHSLDRNGKPIYHANVMMAVGSSLAVVCAECVADEAERTNLLSHLNQHHHVIVIPLSQVEGFCGNVLECVNSSNNKKVLMMSSTAYNNFTQAQREEMLQYVDELVHADISVIEELGGGSVRCTLAELY